MCKHEHTNTAAINRVYRHISILIYMYIYTINHIYMAVPTVYYILPTPDETFRVDKAVTTFSTFSIASRSSSNSNRHFQLH